MSELKNYAEFMGRHWETGALRNFLGYRGFKAPHTGKPYSEALLMGVSGGAVMGYFTFVYEGIDPMCRILTRNTFNPVDTTLSRLGVVQDVYQTASAEKGLKNLVDILESGEPPIVLADAYSLPYNVYPDHETMWMMMPVVVYGVDQEAGTVSIADRSTVPLKVSLEQFQKARGRVKKDRFKLFTISPPNPDKLVSAVQAGIWDCINLYTEKPPKGSRNNFGFQAYRFWIEQLTKPRARLSWARVYPPGREMFAGLTGVYHSVHFFDGFDRAERPLYADFLEECVALLDRPGLQEAADRFREAGDAWAELGLALLPDAVAPFKKARDLMHRRHELFLMQGGAAREEILAIEARQEEIRRSMETDFPLTESESVALLENVAGHVEKVLAIEEAAVGLLNEGMQ